MVKLKVVEDEIVEVLSGRLVDVTLWFSTRAGSPLTFECLNRVRI